MCSRTFEVFQSTKINRYFGCYTCLLIKINHTSCLVEIALSMSQWCYCMCIASSCDVLELICCIVNDQRVAYLAQIMDQSLQISVKCNLCVYARLCLKARALVYLFCACMCCLWEYIQFINVLPHAPYYSLMWCKSHRIENLMLLQIFG